MQSYTFLLMWRYLLGTRAQKNISFMVLICFLGIFVGAFSLALVASIMRGFEHATHEKLQGIHAQIIMRSDTQELDSARIQTIIKNEFPSIIAISPSTFKQVLIQTPNTEYMSNALILKIIDPKTESQTSSIAQTITQPSGKDFVQLLDDKSIVIGQKLADSLDIQIGQEITLVFVTQQEKNPKKVTFSEHNALVAGTFSTGIEEFDTSLILASFSFAQKLFDVIGVTQFNIKIDPYASQTDQIQKLKQRFGLDVFSWKDLYPALVSALQLEKYAMIVILALIALVASMNIISLLTMHIIQKRADIAIYQTMGMHKKNIVRLFMIIGVSIALGAGFLGLIAAFLAGILLQKYPFITLPDTYYVTHLPIHMEWHIFIFVFVLIGIMSLIATRIACKDIQSITISNILRFEG